MVERARRWPDQRGRWLSSQLQVESVCNNWKIYIDMMDILHRLTFSLANWRRKEKYFWLDREDSNANIQVRFIWYPVKGRKCILWHSSFFAVRNISIVTLSLVEWRKNLLWNPSRYQQSQKFVTFDTFDQSYRQIHLEDIFKERHLRFMIVETFKMRWSTKRQLVCQYHSNLIFKSYTG